ncbi:MAG TPA: membrane protein insertion efficiency factor YidD [Alphaproteobacteria bacterium]
MTLAARALAVLVHGYRLLVRPLLPASCRFTPSCSDYALEALARHGAGRGALLAALRLCRCHPWGGFGYDPVPDDARAWRRRGERA